MRFKYKIEQVENEFSNTVSYHAYVSGSMWGWHFIGRAGTHREAVLLCRQHQKPKPGPWLYTAESIMSDGGL